jgi:hypothetical protein
MTAGSLRLKPGMEPHPPHTHPEEEFMLIFYSWRRTVAATC